MQQQYISLTALVNFLLVGLFLFFEMAVQVTPNVMAQPLMISFHLSSAGLGFLSSIYFYSYSLMMIPVGLLYDRFSTKSLLVMALVTLAIGNLLFAVTSYWPLLFVSRLLMGFGSAFAFVGVLVVIQAWFPSKLFAFLVGVTQLMAAFGAMIGETPIAYLVQTVGWRSTSIFFSAFALALALLISLLIKNPSKAAAQAPTSIAAFWSSLKRIVTNPQSIWVAIFAFLSWGPVVIFAELWGSVFLQTRFNVSLIVASLGSTLLWISIALSAPTLGYFAQAITHKRLMVISMLTGAIASLVLIYIPWIHFDIAMLLCFLMGTGCAAQILSFDLVRQNNSAEQFGAGTSFNNFGVVLGGAVLQPLVGILIHANSTHASYHLIQFQRALWLIPICFIVGMFLSLRKINYKNL